MVGDEVGEVKGEPGNETIEDQLGDLAIEEDTLAGELENGDADDDADEDDDDDDDFGSFDDASIEEVTTAHENIFDSDPEQISLYLNTVLLEILPTKPESQPIDTTLDLLNVRSEELLSRLSERPTRKVIMNEHAWKRSVIRREMLLNLGIPLNLDEIKDGKPSFNEPVEQIKETDLNLPKFTDLNISTGELETLLQTTTDHLDSLNIQRAEYYRSISSEEKLKKVKSQLNEELEKLKKLYVSWLDNQSTLQRDNNLFQDYIENMVGNELKFRNEKLKMKLRR